MPRRAAAVRREVMPDAVYNNRLVTQLINKVLLDGKKATARYFFDRQRLTRGRHTLRMTVTDGCENRTVYHADFEW